MATARTPAAPAADQEPMSQFALNIVEYVRAGYQALYVQTSEEARVTREAIRSAQALGNMSLYSWDHFSGFVGHPTVGTEAASVPNDYAKLIDPVAALRTLLPGTSKWPPLACFVFHDLDDFFSAPGVRRALRELIERNQLVNQKIQHPLIVTSPMSTLPPKVRHCFTYVEFTLPDEAQLTKTLKWLQLSLQRTKPTEAQCSEVLQDQIITNLLGFTQQEAANALSKCIIKHAGFKPEMIKTLKEEKQGIMQKGEILTYIPEERMVRKEDVGGYDRYLQFIRRRALAYTKVAKACKIDYPKGVILAGVQGTGKSMVAQATSLELGLPCFTLNIGAVFGSLVGESEQRMRDAIAQITAQQGCVLLIDEADKAWANVTDGRSQDNGVTQRIFGQLLSWLAAKDDRTFVIMTMNRIGNMPPELMRKGRFDEVFFVDLPTEDERQQIFNIHLRRRGLTPEMFGNEADWRTIITATHDFSGAEIEEMVKDARFFALERYCSQFSEPSAAPISPAAGQPTFDDLMKAIKGTKPGAQLYSADLTAMREFCKDKAVPVSWPKAPSATQPLRSLRV